MRRDQLRERLAKVRREIASPRDALLAIRIGLWAGTLRLLKRVVPLAVLVRLVRRDARTGRDPDRERQIIALSRWACRLWAWPSRDSCLERALVMYRFLGRIGANPRLVFGFARSTDSRLRGHAWVLVDRKVIDDDLEALTGFSQAAEFGPDGRLLPAAD